jgi:hypothetical protein
VLLVLEYSKLHGWYLDCQANLELIFRIPATELNEVPHCGQCEQEKTANDEEDGDDEEVDRDQGCSDEADNGEEGQDHDQSDSFPLVFGEVVKVEVHFVFRSVGFHSIVYHTSPQKGNPALPKQNGAYIPIGLYCTVSSQIFYQPNDSGDHQNPSNYLNENVDAPHEGEKDT